MFQFFDFLKKGPKHIPESSQHMFREGKVTCIEGTSLSGRKCLDFFLPSQK